VTKKAPISFVASVCRSVSMYQLGSRRKNFCGEIWYWGLVWKSVEKLHIWLKSDAASAHVLLLPAINILHKGIFVQHSVFLCCWQKRSPKYTHNTFWLSTVTVVTRTRHDAALHEQCILVSSRLPPSYSSAFKSREAILVPFAQHVRTGSASASYSAQFSYSSWRLLWTRPEIAVFRKFLMTPHILDASPNCLDVRYELMSRT